MKKLFLTFIIITLSILAFSIISVSAETEDIFTYVVSGDEATITACDTSASGEVVIPSTIEGYPVTNIGEAAFKDCSRITSIEIPNGVKSVGKEAFYNCGTLKTIIIPESITNIGNYAFYKCTNITQINWNAKNVADFYNQNHIFTYAGKNATGIKVVFGDEVESIPAYIFYPALTTVYYDSYEPKISSVTFGNNVKRIGEWAFAYCTTLNNIVIPDSVTSIGGSAFSDTGLYKNSSNWENNVLYIGKHLINVKRNSVSGDYKIKDGTIVISDMAFNNCDNITSISIPNSVTIIGASAFNDCDSITSMTIPSSVTSIGDNAFYHCSVLASVSIPDSVTSIGKTAFTYCSKLVSITIPESVTSVGNYAFFNCNSLSDVYYDGTEEKWSEISIGSDNTCLTNATIHYNCKILKYITYTITDHDDVKITACDTGASGNISIPSTIEGYPVTTIDYNAFKGCDKITSVVFPDSVTDIYGSAFENCTALSNITFTDNVKWIGGSAFGNCTSLTSVTLPAGLSDIGDRAFYGCTNLTSIEIDENNSEFCSIDGNLFDKNVTTMLQYSIGKSESAYIIPDGVTMIDTYCFEDSVNLTSITIPQSVKTIGLAAFRDCSNIENIYYYGKQNEWSKISIGNYNDGLNKVTIHFIYPRTETVLSNNDKTFTITPINIAAGNMVILALYNGTTLVEVQSLVYTGESILFTTTKDYANAKVFVWESFETLVPICEAEIVK